MRRGLALHQRGVQAAKTDLESKLGRITAEAGWIPTGISRVFLVHRCQRCPTDLERKHA